jgi:hypothetical protein
VFGLSLRGSGTHLASLVLGDLVLGVLAALLALAVGLPSLGNVDLEGGPWSAFASLPVYVPGSRCILLALQSTCRFGKR